MKASGEIRLVKVACRIPLKRTLTALGTAIGSLILSLGTGSYAQTNVTPAQYLQSQPKPNFAAGHHLPTLTFWLDGAPASNTCVELANNWNYALMLECPNFMCPLDVSNIIAGSSANLGYVDSRGFLTMASNNPAKYKIGVIMGRFISPTIPANFWVTNSSGQFVLVSGGITNVWSTNRYDAGSFRWYSSTNSAWQPMISPEAPNVDITNEVEYWMADLRALQSNAPITMILNGGEYELDGVVGGKETWMLDPRVQQQAPMTNVYSNPDFYRYGPQSNGVSWQRYSSDRKAHHLAILYSAIKRDMTNRQEYIFYWTSGEKFKWTAEFPDWFNSPYAGWYWDGDATYSSVDTPPYTAAMGATRDTMNGSVDLPSTEDYWGSTASFRHQTVFEFDLLTEYLDSVGFNIADGYPLNYSWVTAGCGGTGHGTNEQLVADIPTYTGHLKCLFTAGMVGAVAGYYQIPPGTNVSWILGGPGYGSSFPSTMPPHWLLQLMALSHTQALFSHLEPFLTNGDLLSGPQPHQAAADQPAYEFTNTVANVNDRVLARKLRGQNQWIVTAWAADGITTNVTVTIPTLGNLTVAAVPSASVYQVTMTGTNVQQTLLDEYTSFPVTPPIILTGAAKLPNGAFQFAFTNTPAVTNYIATNITTTIITNWSTRGPPRITGYTTNITTTVTTNTSENTVTVLTTTNLLLPLTNWTVLGTVTDSPPGHFQFTDPQAANRPMRFYRVRSP